MGFEAKTIVTKYCGDPCAKVEVKIIDKDFWLSEDEYEKLI
jgi:hypothetical protein